MQFKVTEEKENPLFNRKEIFFEIHASVTPSRLETSKSVSEKFSVPVENIKIKSINGKFGSDIFSGSAFIYNSEKDKDKVEIKKKKDVTEKEALKPKEPEEKPVVPKEEPKEEEKTDDADIDKSDKKDNVSNKNENLTKENPESKGEANKED